MTKKSIFRATGGGYQVGPAKRGAETKDAGSQTLKKIQSRDTIRCLKANHKEK